MGKISDTKLKAIIDKHAKWLRGADGGECADLRGADLSGANLHSADLRGADLRDANLRDAKNTNKITGMRPRPFTRYSVLRPARLSDIKKPRAKSSCWRYVPMLSVAVLLRVNAGAARRRC